MGLCWAGPDSQGWKEVQGPQSCQVTCRQAWKTDWARSQGKRVATKDKGRATQPDPYVTLTAPPPCLQVGRFELT